MARRSNLASKQKSVASRVQPAADGKKPQSSASGKRTVATHKPVRGALINVLSILRLIRCKQQKSLEEISEAMGISKGVLVKLETSRPSNVTIATLYKVAAALGQDLQISIVAKPESNDHA